MKVSLFVTCLGDTFYPRSAIAVVKVLEHFGCEVDFPETQTCCGQPLYNNGFHQDAGVLARRMVDVFEGSDHVVTPSGSCAAMVRDYYEGLLGDDPAYAEGCRRLLGRLYEFVEFLTEVLEVDVAALDIDWKRHVTYHFACHLRGLGVNPQASAAEMMLQKIGGVTYTRAEKLEQCCGFGGTFAMKYSEISGTMVRDKVRCLQATGADTVVSNDAGCTMNISGTCQRDGVPLQFMHIAEILAEGLGLMPAGTSQPA